MNKSQFWNITAFDHSGGLMPSSDTQSFLVSLETNSFLAKMLLPIAGASKHLQTG